MSHSNISIFVPHSGCPHQCAFCNQKSITGSEAQIPEIEKVRKICRQALSEVKNPKDCEIAFFGGSFTAINRADMLSLLNVANEFIGKDKFCGIRISTRPDCIYPEILDVLKQKNVKTIELGAQSMDDEVLIANERGHSANDVVDASRMILDYGFDLGLQMMTGLYKSTTESDIMTARSLISLKPSQVRIYPTVILENTILGEYFKKGIYQSYSLEQTVELCAELLEMFYENDIPVIKLGLHASELVEAKMLGGVYHPAFRELCEGMVFRNRIERKLICAGIKNAVILIPKGKLSQVVGQKKVNSEYFKNKGYELRFIECDKLNGYQIKIEEEKSCI